MLEPWSGMCWRRSGCAAAPFRESGYLCTNTLASMHSLLTTYLVLTKC